MSFAKILPRRVATAFVAHLGVWQGVDKLPKPAALRGKARDRPNTTPTPYSCAIARSSCQRRGRLGSCGPSLRHPRRLRVDQVESSAFARARRAMTCSRISAFKLDKDAKHLKHRSAGRRRRCRAPAGADRGRRSWHELLQHAHQVRQRPAQTVDRPGGDHVDVGPGYRLHQRVEARALVASF